MRLDTERSSDTYRAFDISTTNNSTMHFAADVPEHATVRAIVSLFHRMCRTVAPLNDLRMNVRELSNCIVSISSWLHWTIRVAPWSVLPPVLQPQRHGLLTADACPQVTRRG